MKGRYMTVATGRTEPEECGGDLYLQHDDFGARVYCGKCGMIFADYGMSASGNSVSPLKLPLRRKHA